MTHPDHAAELRRTLIDVKAVCSHLGLAIDRRQRSKMGVKVLCPSHKERTASCNVSLGEDGTIRVKCFACGFSGDVLTLIAAAKGLDLKASFRSVLLAAAELGGRWDIIDAIELEQQAEELRRRLVDIPTLLSQLALAPISSTPKSSSATCPKCRMARCDIFHAKTGILWAKCSCGLNGDVLELVAAAKGLDVQNDLRGVLLATAELSSQIDISILVCDNNKRNLTQPIPLIVEVAPDPPTPTLPPEAFEAIVRPLFWVGWLDGSPISADATAYLDGRGLLDAAIGEGWGCLPPSGESQDAWVRMLLDVLPPEDLKASGLLWRRSFAFPEHRLCIPWRSPEGRIYTIQRRRLDSQKENKYVFPSGHPAHWPYGIERLASAPADAPLVFVEGAIDVLARRILDAKQGKTRVVLGVPGGGWRAEWAKLAKGRIASIASDADETGAKYVEEWSGALFKAGAKKVTRIEPMGANDWGEIVRIHE